MIPTRASLLLRLRNAEDVAAWDDFMSIYSPVIYRVALKRGLQPADAENLVQEVITAVSISLEHWLERIDRGGFRAWLFTIARNESIKMMTHRTTRPMAHGGTDAGEILNKIPAKSDLTRELDLEYDRSIFQWAARQVEKKVDATNWQAFWMTAIDNVSVDDAARRLNIETGQVYCARSRVMAKIKNLVQQYKDSP
ncbi:MAG: sigma-70 family RNA polymerase sigma factor [Pirellulaceae bacterium]